MFYYLLYILPLCIYFPVKRGKYTQRTHNICILYDVLIRFCCDSEAGDMPTYMNNIENTFKAGHKQVPLRRRSSLIVQHFLMYVGNYKYMYCLCFESHSIALTQSMSVRYSQRICSYICILYSQKCIGLGISLYNTSLNKSHRDVFAIVCSSLSLCNLYCRICAYPAIYIMHTCN